MQELWHKGNFSPLLQECLDRQQSQRMLGYGDPTKAVWRYTNPWTTENSNSYMNFNETTCYIHQSRSNYKSRELKQPRRRQRNRHKIACVAGGIIMPGYCFGGGTTTRERRSREGFSRQSIRLVLILLAAPPPILFVGLPHTAFSALIPPATQGEHKTIGLMGKNNPSACAF